MKLDEDQKLIILNHWNNKVEENGEPPSLRELTTLLFGPERDARSKECHSIRKFLASRELKAKKPEYTPKNKTVSLSEDDKEYIRNNRVNMTYVEMAKAIFKNDKLKQWALECRLVRDYLHSIKDEINSCESILDDQAYHPNNYHIPRDQRDAIAKINDAVKNSGFDIQKLNARQKKQIEALISYMGTFRFMVTMDSFESVTDRKLFEHSFVKYTYNKEDLEQEDVDQFIILSNEVVLARQSLARLQDLRGILERQAREGERGEAITVRLAQMIKEVQTEYNNSINRQKNLYDALTKKRSKRLEDRISENQSMLGLITYFREQENRAKLLAFAEKRKEGLKNEIERLQNLDALKCEIFGMDPEEILNG